jgi:ring-1,2-phenylacetyl-CoA epoxidase subunit PaaC
MNQAALKDLLYKMADDQLILGHRNSEWIGLGPILEEDIAFASMAQDKVGQSLAIYEILHQLGEADPDTVAFSRNAPQFHNCKLVELPIGEYDFSLIRHFLFDTADYLRFEMLATSSFEPLQQLAKKFKGETRYHTMHGDLWIKQLGAGTEESIGRLQKALDYALPFALGIFEPSGYEDELMHAAVFGGEKVLQGKWEARVEDIINSTELTIPDWTGVSAEIGGRSGDHTEHLQPLLDEMSEVINIDPTADW